VDVKLAKPRNNTSPNFKAFKFDDDHEKEQKNKTPPLKKLNSDSKEYSTGYSDIVSPLYLSSDFQIDNTNNKYFSISNTFATSKISEFGHSDSLVRRISDIFSNSSNKKKLVEQKSDNLSSKSFNQVYKKTCYNFITDDNEV